MTRSKLKEALRPLVRESLSDYLKDSEQDLRALQAAHPQLDLTADLPSETGSGDNVTKGVRTEARGVEVEWHGRTAVVPNFPKNMDAYSMLRFCDNVEHEGGSQYRFDNVYPEVKKKFIDVVTGKVKLQKEASTTAANPDMGYQTPNAFSNTSLDKDVKKRKIAQQLGMKIVKKGSVNEELRINVAKAVPLLEGFQPRVISPEAKKLYDTISYYMMVAADPSYKRIHQFRVAIQKLRNMNDQKQMIQYFNDEFRISPSQSAWDYYAKVD